MSYASHLIGKSYGKLGTVVAKPAEGSITGYASDHALNRAVNRDITTLERLEAVRHPRVVLEQRGGLQHVYINDRGVVVLNQDGEIVTTYGQSDFDESIRQILADAVH